VKRIIFHRFAGICRFSEKQTASFSDEKEAAASVYVTGAFLSITGGVISGFTPSAAYTACGSTAMLNPARVTRVRQYARKLI